MRSSAAGARSQARALCRPSRTPGHLGLSRPFGAKNRGPLWTRHSPSLKVGTLTTGFGEQVKVWLARHGSRCLSSTPGTCINGPIWWRYGLDDLVQQLHHLTNLFPNLLVADPVLQFCLKLCFEEHIPSNRPGNWELTAFRSSHYQLENEPFSKENWPGLPLSQWGQCFYFLSRHTSGAHTGAPQHFFIVKSLLLATSVKCHNTPTKRPTVGSPRYVRIKYG